MRHYLCVALALLIVPACAPATAPVPVPATSASNPYGAARQAGLARLLAQWATALRTNDQQLLDRIVDPGAAPGFRQAQLARAVNLRGVPLQQWDFIVGDGPEIVVPAAQAEALGAADTWAGQVHLRYAISGADPVPGRQSTVVTAARRGDEWRLVSESGRPDRPSARGPWDFGPLAASTVGVDHGRKAVVLGHEAQRAEIDSIATELPGAVRAVTEVWGMDWPGTVLVLITGSQAEFAELAGPGPLDDVAAVAVSDPIVAGAPITGQRVIFGPGAVTRLGAGASRAVLRHELTHVAARAVTRVTAPLWLTEGFADYVGYRGRPVAGVAPGLVREPPAGLPADAEFADPARAQRAYEISWAVCAFVADSRGEQQLVRLYRRGAGPAVVADPLHDVLGVSAAQFWAQLRAWLGGQR